MKHLKLFENYQNIPGEMSINNFLMEIAETSKPLESIENWWNINRKDIKLNYFPFNTTKPIMGVFIGNKYRPERIGRFSKYLGGLVLVFSAIYLLFA